MSKIAIHQMLAADRSERLKLDASPSRMDAGLEKELCCACGKRDFHSGFGVILA